MSDSLHKSMVELAFLQRAMAYRRLKEASDPSEMIFQEASLLAILTKMNPRRNESNFHETVGELIREPRLVDPLVTETLSRIKVYATFPVDAKQVRGLVQCTLFFYLAEGVHWHQWKTLGDLIAYTQEACPSGCYLAVVADHFGVEPRIAFLLFRKFEIE